MLGLWIDGHESGDYLFVAVLYAGAWALGASLRERSHRARRLEGHAELLERERERRRREAVLEERARIARELHDVVAHSVSVMVVQNGVVRRRIRRGSPRRGGHPGGVRADRPPGARRDATAARAPAHRGRAARPGAAAGDGQPARARRPGTRRRAAGRAARRGRRVAATRRGSISPPTASSRRALTERAQARRRRRRRRVLRPLRRRGGSRSRSTTTGPGATAADGNGHGLVGMRERAALYGGDAVRGAGATAVASRCAAALPRRRARDDPGGRRRRPGDGAARASGSCSTASPTCRWSAEAADGERGGRRGRSGTGRTWCVDGHPDARPSTGSRRRGGSSPPTCRRGC